MIRQLGPANIFLTLSAAETRWTHLLRILSQVVDNTYLSDEDVAQLTWSQKCRLISSDPVTCARHFDYCIQQFFNKFLKSTVSPFGTLTDFWYRIEFQHRGSPHLHCLLWLSGIPVYGVNSNDEVTRYVDKIITCRRNWNDEELDSLVQLQTHKHTRTCKKQFRKTTICRFGFPKFPMSTTQILEPYVCDTDEAKVHSKNFTLIKSVLAAMKPGEDNITMDQFLSKVCLDLDSYVLAIRSTLSKPTLFIQRQPSELRVNNYNVDCLRAWRANMDVQYILDVYACATYITSYVAKSSRGMSELLRNACE